MSVAHSQAGLDLEKLNSHFLMVAQKQLSIDPITAKHNLGLDDATADFIRQLSPLDVHTLAESGVSAIKFRFDEASISHLKNYIAGDNFAITQAVLGLGV
jgi:hypothetical protein